MTARSTSRRTSTRPFTIRLSTCSSRCRLSTRTRISDSRRISLWILCETECACAPSPFYTILPFCLVAQLLKSGNLYLDNIDFTLDAVRDEMKGDNRLSKSFYAAVPFMISHNSIESSLRLSMPTHTGTGFSSTTTRTPPGTTGMRSSS